VRGSIQSIERGAAILRLLSGGSRGLSLVEIARALDLPKGTAHGLLRTLRHVGFVEQDGASSRYRLGAALLHIGASYLDGNELRSQALNWSDTLAARSGESVRIGTLHEGRVLVVHHVFRPDDSAQVLEVGTLLTAHACALGKVLLAFDSAVAERVLRMPLEPATEATVVRPHVLRRELAQVVARDWAADNGELVPGEASVAAPIRDHRLLVVGAICISGSARRLYRNGEPRPELVAYVTEAAHSISSELGAAPQAGAPDSVPADMPGAPQSGRAR
jgi:DNA-binding IclR family transcriptional regulator